MSCFNLWVSEKSPQRGYVRCDLDLTKKILMDDMIVKRIVMDGSYPRHSTMEFLQWLVKMLRTGMLVVEHDFILMMDDAKFAKEFESFINTVNSFVWKKANKTHTLSELSPSAIRICIDAHVKKGTNGFLLSELSSQQNKPEALRIALPILLKNNILTPVYVCSEVYREVTPVKYKLTPMGLEELIVCKGIIAKRRAQSRQRPPSTVSTKTTVDKAKLRAKEDMRTFLSKIADSMF